MSNYMEEGHYIDIEDQLMAKKSRIGQLLGIGMSITDILLEDGLRGELNLVNLVVRERSDACRSSE